MKPITSNFLPKILQIISSVFLKCIKSHAVLSHWYLQTIIKLDEALRKVKQVGLSGEITERTQTHSCFDIVKLTKWQKFTCSNWIHNKQLGSLKKWNLLLLGQGTKWKAKYWKRSIIVSWKQFKANLEIESNISRWQKVQIHYKYSAFNSVVLSNFDSICTLQKPQGKNCILE